jgi:outer membrane protein assembly factor BamB
MRKLVVPAAAVTLALAATAVAANRPPTISLPDGFQPEGIAAQGSRLFVGSLADGGVWTSDTKGRGARVLVPGQTGRSVAGIKVSGNKIFAAGAGSGKIYVFNRRTGRDIRTYTVPDAGFINDVVLQGGNAYFTESAAGKQVFYVVRRSGRGGVRTVPISGDLAYQGGPNDFNANGIAAIGRRLLTVQTNTGGLFTLDPATGASKQIALRGKATSLVNGDGLLRKGRTLYVVQNQDNKIAVVQLSRDLSKGTITRYLRDADFDVPTTLARAGGDLWTVNARFGTTPTATTTYDVVRVGRP